MWPSASQWPYFNTFEILLFHQWYHFYWFLDSSSNRFQEELTVSTCMVGNNFRPYLPCNSITMFLTCGIHALCKMNTPFSTKSAWVFVHFSVALVSYRIPCVIMIPWRSWSKIIICLTFDCVHRNFLGQGENLCLHSFYFWTSVQQRNSKITVFHQVFKLHRYDIW